MGWNYSPRSKQYPKEFLRTVVEEFSSIGANSTILGGVTLGKYSMIGAGSVVTKNVGEHELWYGNPAKFSSYVCKCGQKADETFVCKECKGKN